jgi:tape measure domain-containing protein
MTEKRIRIILDSKGAKRNADELNQSVRGIGDGAEKSQFSVNKLAAAIAAVISTQKIAQFADAFTRVQNQLIRTVGSTEELAAATQQLLDVANLTRAGIEPTVELYTALTVSTKDLAISQGELVDVTKTINNLFLESGKGANETAGAIRQLGQALESGALRGDEFNSVAEGAPGILRAIQKETGLTRAELRELAADGQITAELIVKSLQNYSEEAQKAADKTRVTLAQAFTVADNNLTNFIGQINDATGASSAFAGAIIDLTNYIGSPEFISGVLQAFNTARLTINSASDSVGHLSNEIQLLKDTGSGAVGVLGEAFKNLLPNIRSLIQIVTVETASAFDKLRISGTALFKIFSDPFDVANLKASMAEYNLQMEAVNEARRSSIEDSLNERETVIETARKSAEAYAKQAAARKAIRDGGGDTESSLAGSPSVAGKKSDSDNGERENANIAAISGAQSVTKSLEQELALRRQVSDIYRSAELGADASMYEQQLAMINARAAEEAVIAQARAGEEMASRSERLSQLLANDQLENTTRDQLRAQYDNQEKIARQLLNEELNAIDERAANERIRIAEIERQSKIQLWGDMASSGIALLQAFGSKSQKSQKLFARASIIADTAQGIAKGVALGWPAAVPAIAFAVAGGKRAMDALNSSSMPSGGGSSLSSAPAATSAPSTSAPTQSSFVIRLEGLDAIPDDAILSGRFVKQIGEKLEQLSADGVRI